MQFAYTVKGITESNRTKDEIEVDLREAAEEATDDGLHEVTEVVVAVVSD